MSEIQAVQTFGRKKTAVAGTLPMSSVTRFREES